MSDEIVIPPLVKRLAEEVHMTPLSWFVADDHVTIVFVEGQKLTFDKPVASVGARRVSPASKSSILPKSLDAPIQKLADDFIAASPNPPSSPRRRGKSKNS